MSRPQPCHDRNADLAAAVDGKRNRFVSNTRAAFVSHYSLYLTNKLPLRLCCRAAPRDGKVYLYQGRSDCMAIVDLKLGEVPTPELIVRRIGMAALKVLSDWVPGA